MTPTTWNGVLIVAISVALGMYKADDVMIIFGFAMAGLSYVVNVADELGVSDYGLRYAVMAVGVVAFIKAAMLLTPGALPLVQ